MLRRGKFLSVGGVQHVRSGVRVVEFGTYWLRYLTLFAAALPFRTDALPLYPPTQCQPDH